MGAIETRPTAAALADEDGDARPLRRPPMGIGASSALGTTGTAPSGGG